MQRAASSPLTLAHRLVLFLLLAVAAPAMLAQQADLLVTKSGPSEAPAGSDVAYDITVRNLGPDASADASVDDPIPAGMTFVSATQNSGPAFICSTPAAGDPGNVTCSVATLAAGETATFTFVFHIPSDAAPGTTFTNFAVVMASTFDPNDENNAAPASTTVPPPPQADLTVQKLAAAAAGPDSDLPFTITLKNAGPAAATNVTLTDTLPGDTTFVSLTQDGPALNCTTPAIGAGGTVTCTAATFPAGATTTLTLTVHVPAGTPSGTEYTNTASVTSDNDPNDENNTATVSVMVTSVDVSVVKDGPATGTAGQPIVYTITVANAGPDPAEQIVLTDPIPAGTTFVSIETTSTATCTVDGSVVCTLPALNAGSSEEFTLTVTAGDVTSVTNTATADTSSFDTDATNDSDDATTTVTPSADLAVVKSGPATATAGQDVTYTITVANNGPSNAADVSLTDTLPGEATFVSMTQTAGPAFSCASTTCTIATLASGASATFELVLHANASASGSLDNTATVASSTGDPDSTNNDSTSSATIVTSADLSVVKSGPAAATAGENVTYTITVANAGPSDAANVSMGDVLPANTTFVSVNQTSGPAFTCTTPAAGTNGTVTCSIATLISGATAAFDLVVSVDPAASGSLANTATLSTATTDPNGANNDSTSTATLSGSADVSVVKNGPDAATAGQTIAYTLTVANAGPSNAADVTLTDALPANTTFASLAQTSGPSFNCTTPSAGASGTVTCTIATLADGASAAFDLVLNIAPSATGTLSNTATVTRTTADPNSANDTSTSATSLSGSADLSVTKNGPATANAGDNVTYTITIANAGPSDAANATLTDALPPDTTFVALTQQSGPTFNCTTPAAGANGTVTCTLPVFASGGSATFQLVANVAPSATGSAANTANASASTADPNGENNASTSTIALTTAADLSVTKSGPAIATAGADATYTIVVANHGPSDASNVTLTDVLPATTTFVSLAQPGGPAFNCTTPAAGATGTVTCTIATLIDGATATFELVVHVSPSHTGSVSNTASVAATTADPNAPNNSSTSNTAAATDADLAVSKTGPASAIPGQDLTYTITLVNNGPSDASNVTLNDVLPANTAFVSLAQTAGPTFDCTTPPAGTTGTVTCTIATLTLTTSTFELVVHVDENAAGTIANTATASSTTNDPSPGNSASTSMVSVETADLAIEKSASPTTVGLSDAVTYTIVVTNNGPDSASGVTVTDTLPDGVKLQSATPTQGNCTGTSTITCALGTLAPDASATITLAVTMPQSTGVVTNSASVTADQADPVLANNTSSTDVTVALNTVAAIPTLSPWMLAALALGLAAVVLMRR